MVVLTTFPQPTEGIRLEQRDTTAHLNNKNIGKGTLYIAESNLSWISSTGDGFSIEYPRISLHAVSRDLNAFPEPCLFLLLDSTIEESEEVDENDPDCQGTTELRFVPDDSGMVNAMFDAMSACQALHPDPNDSFSDEDFYEDADEDVPIDETNSQMANLSIEQSRGACRVVGNGCGTAGSREAADRVADKEADMVADMAADTVAGRASRPSCSVSDMAEGMAEGTAEGTAEGMAEGRAAERTRLFSTYRRFYSSSTREAESSTMEEDTECTFDDAES